MFEAYGCTENIHVYWIHFMIFRNKESKVQSVNKLLPLGLMDVRLVQVARGAIGFDFIYEFTQEHFWLTIHWEYPNQLLIKNGRFLVYQISNFLVAFLAQYSRDFGPNENILTVSERYLDLVLEDIGSIELEFTVLKVSL